MSKGESTKAILRTKKTVRKAVKGVATKTTAGAKPAANTVSNIRIAKKSLTPNSIRKKTSHTTKTLTSSTKVNLERTSTFKNRLAVPASWGLMVLSPLRFPLDVDKIAVQTARYAGAFFVAIGAILTMWHSSLVFSAAPPMNFMAQVFMNDRSQTMIDPIENEIEPVEQKFANASVAFIFEPSKPISGDSVLVQVELPGETYEAYLYARNTNTGATVDFGAFDSFSSSLAETYIDVTDVSDGTYRFYTVATYESERDGPYTITVTDTSRQEIYFVSEVDETVTYEEDFDAEADETATYEEDIEIDTETEDILEPLEETDEEIAVSQEPLDPTNPEIKVVLAASRLTGNSELVVNVAGASYLEVYALQENTGTQRYVGLPKQIEPGTWSYSLDTTDLPNGLYSFTVNVRTKYGFFTQKSSIVSLYNETKTTIDAVALDYQTNALDVNQLGVVDVTMFGTQSETTLSPEEQVDQLVAPTSSTEALHATAFSALIEVHQQELEQIMQILAVAYRAGNIDQIKAASERISAFIDALSIESPDLLSFTTQEIEKLTLRITADVETTNKIITERTGVTAETDTDRDGITDFDEIVIYKTNPQVADSDGDGFTDGAEVLSGFNPTDSTPQVPVAYESPQDSGIIRDDLLRVETIATESVDDDVMYAPAALITGKGLPNSFVTLYIFSTPIVVTVRTDSEGSWIYRFDKELEDGQHQIYAGITDNAGKIVAKSNPLTFVKVAEAYELLEAPAPGVIKGTDTDNSDTHSMISLILVTASISVVAIGLVLILLGVHLESRNRREFIKTAESV